MALTFACSIPGILSKLLIVAGITFALYCAYKFRLLELVESSRGEADVIGSNLSLVGFPMVVTPRPETLPTELAKATISQSEPSRVRPDALSIALVTPTISPNVPIRDTFSQESKNATILPPSHKNRQPKLDKRYTYCSGLRWRPVLSRFFDKNKLKTDGDVYEFGVFNGRSMSILRKSPFKSNRMWGFDSFQGLPSENADVGRTDWGVGTFRSETTPEKLQEKLGRHITQFIVGFYSQSLTPHLHLDRGMAPAIYIDLDADLYLSTFEVLDWLFTVGLVRRGTLIGYDDFWAYPCAKNGVLHPLGAGAGRAHKEIADKYMVDFTCVAGGCSFRRKQAQAQQACSFGVVFIVDGLRGTVDHGFEMTHAEVETWKSSNMKCAAERRKSSISPGG